MLRTPVALILFNRPEMTGRVMREIAKARPARLFLIGDGPRPHRPEDAEKCAAARAAAEDLVDWDCEVLTNYSESNLGCGRRPATGIDWLFEHAEQAIIFEDDCVPHPTFFPFCDELLERYEDDQRVFQIAGNKLQFGSRRGSNSYFFSVHNICNGGWATWRRAWRHYDYAVKLWPTLRSSSWLTNALGDDQRALQSWREKFDEAYEKSQEVDFWDYQWTFACWAQKGLTAIPNSQLLSNIGYGEEATHTTWAGDRWANLPTAAMTFPLRHPEEVYPHAEADRFFVKNILPVWPPRRSRLRQIVSSVTPPPVRKAISFLRSSGHARKVI